MVIHVDSSYLVDLLREQARGRQGRATAMLAAHATDQFAASVFVVCELEAGAALAASPDRERARLRVLLQAINIVYPDERFAATYGEALAAVRRSGKTVDTMDLLIGTAALVDGAHLLTGHTHHFQHIPGLQLLSHRSG